VATVRVGAAWPVGEVQEFDDGSSEIAIDTESFEWITGWVLGFGRHAWIVDPPEARAAMVERVAQLRGRLSGAVEAGGPAPGGPPPG
jgi:predicted DNA-binding transcriptional regulator YafY